MWSEKMCVVKEVGLAYEGFIIQRVILGLGEINMWCGVGEGDVICKSNWFKKANKV